MSRIHRPVQRAGWGIADQAFSSLTNFALGLVIARTQAPEAFGAFAIAFTTYVVALNVSRGLFAEPLVVRYSASPLPRWRGGTSSAVGGAAVTGLVIGAGCLLFGWLVGGAMGQALLALGITLPGLLVQDSWRFGFFACRRPALAFVNDAAWAVLLFPSLWLLGTSGHSSIFALTLAWGGSATGAAILGAAQSRLLPRPASIAVWLREQRDLAYRFLAEFMALSGTVQLVFYGIGAIAGLTAVAAVRGAQILLGPVYVFSIGVRAVAVPEAITILRRSRAELERACLLMSGTLATITVIWGAVVFAIPERVGNQILGPSWGPAHSVIIPITLAMAGGHAILGANTGLRALAAAGRSLRARLMVSSLQLTGGIVGAVVGGVRAAAWGLVVAGWTGAILYWASLRSALREGEGAVGVGQDWEADARLPRAVEGGS